ncbi:MAG TPA: hypothetical protein VMG08_12600 [Allosphingosinicella sp.]|nr:hypothetical protein [Allosphingosinicella sp.]
MTADRAIKEPCRLATTGNITLTGLQTIDGVTTASGDRVLVKNQSSASQNGVYIAAGGAWARATDLDGAGEAIGGIEVFVTSGTANAGTSWRIEGNGPITIGTDPIPFAPAYAARSVTYAQTGTGAVERTVAERFAESVHVTDFGSLQEAYNALPAAGGAVIVPAGYAETLAADLVMNKPFAGFLFIGPATITMGTYQLKILKDTTGAFLDYLGAMVGGDRHGSIIANAGVLWIYSGDDVLCNVGSSEGPYNTQHVRISGQVFNTSLGDPTAINLRFQRVTHSQVWNTILRGFGSQTGGAFVMDGAGTGPNLGDPYCGFIDTYRLEVISTRLGIQLLNQVNYTTHRAMSVNGPDAASGTTGIHIQRGYGNFFETNLGGWEKGLYLAGHLAEGNRFVAYNEANTLDVDAASGSSRNVFLGIGEDPLATADANGATSTNCYSVTGNLAAANLDLPQHGYVRLNTPTGLTRAFGINMSNECYIGSSDRAIAGINFVMNPASVAYLTNLRFQTLGKISPGTPAGAYQANTGLTAGNGAPNNSNGANGDFYFRADGTVAGNTVLYHKEAGAWVALTTT